MGQVSKKIIKDNAMSLNKQQIKLLISFLSFYENKWANSLKKKEENLVIFSGLSLIYIT